MSSISLLWKAGALSLLLSTAAWAEGRKPPANVPDWQVVTGTITSVVPSEGRITLANRRGGVQTYLIQPQNTHVIYTGRPQEGALTDILPGDQVTLYVAKDSQVVGRVIYPAGAENRAAAPVASTPTIVSPSVAASTPTVIAPAVTASTPTVVSPAVTSSTPTAATPGLASTAGDEIVGLVVARSNNGITILRGDGATVEYPLAHPVTVEGGSTVSRLPLNTKVRVWTDPQGRATRVSSQPADVNF